MFSRLRHLAVLVSLPVSYIAHAGPHAGYTQTALIPWLDRVQGEYDFINPPHVHMWISKDDAGTGLTSRMSFLVDTGTCGIVVPMEKVDIKEWEKDPDFRAYQWLSSSKILYVGWWVDRWVWFNHNDPANEVKSHLRILAMEKKYTNCKGWTPTSGDACPNTDAVENTSDRSVSMLGIGFGRMYDGQPQGLPERNPLLNVQSVGPGPLTAFWPGWIIDTQGITAGLTDVNWNRFEQYEIPLGEDSGAPPADSDEPAHHFAWGETPGCVIFPGLPSSTCIICSVLFDTGIDYASIRVPRATADALRRGTPSNSLLLLNGQTVDVRVGNAAGPPFSVELYTTPDTPWRDCDSTPAYTNVYYDYPVATARFPFVNTGRHIFRRQALGYDPVRGRAATSWHTLPTSLTGPPPRHCVVGS